MPCCSAASLFSKASDNSTASPIFIFTGLLNLVIAINLSVRQFKAGGLVSQIRAVLDETGLDPQYLELEITESLFIEGDNSLIASMLQDLKELGTQLAIDDFGTGYSSLSYLRRFPVDKLKIDQSFVQGMATNADDASLVSAIIAIARSLNLSVIAEGVETVEQLHMLRRDSCDFMQGFFFSRPLPAEAFASLVRSGKALQLDGNLTG